MFISFFPDLETADITQAVLSQHLGDYSLSQSAMSCCLNVEMWTVKSFPQREVIETVRGNALQLWSRA